ncbi:Protocatechuate 4,5-dioxygenase beta chain [compost metagenome]
MTQNNEQLAGFIAQHGFDNGFDWAVARSFSVDHAVSIPHHLVVKPAQQALGYELPCIPVYLACAVDPFLSLKRTAELGREIRAAVEAFPADERVVVIGSGGISHWVGTAEMGRVNEGFDREVLAHGVAGDLEALCAYSNEQIIGRAGNGAMEIRNLICALAAVEGGKGEVVGYEAVEPWVTGMGFLAVKPS